MPRSQLNSLGGSSFDNIYIANLLYESATNGITAGTTRTQAGATALTLEVNSVNTSTAPAAGSTLGDGVRLMPSVAGLDITVINNTGNLIQVYGNGTDTINGIAGATGIPLPPGDVAQFECPVAGAWFVEAGVGVAGALPVQLAVDGLTATGTNQGTALALPADFNRFTTVASGTGAVLPVAKAGLDIFVLNHGANSLQVYGNGTDTINDVAGATGVPQMVGSVTLYTCYANGAWYTEGLSTGYAGGLQTLSFTNSITAFAGGGQGSATALPSLVNRVTTVATTGDSVKLPASAAGLAVTVINKGANPMQVFGNGTDTINGIAVATGISQGINTTAVYICSVAGNWEVPITALQSSTPAVINNAGTQAVPSHTGHTYVVTKGSAQAMTLAAPTATTDDGIEITITSNTAFAHTLTATGLLQTGTASVNVATFAAFAGAGLTLMAYQGKWNVLSSVGITFS